MAIYFVILSFYLLPRFPKYVDKKMSILKQVSISPGINMPALWIRADGWRQTIFLLFFLLRFRVSVFENIQFFIHRMIYTALSVINLERTTKC